MLYPDQNFVRLPENSEGRDFFIGDLHGCVPLLERLMHAVHFDTEKDRLFGVGDLIDHGPDSFGALKRLQGWPFFHSVLGNHEAMALGAMGLMRSYTYGGEAWMRNGGDWINHFDDEQVQLAGHVMQGMPMAIEVPLRDGRRVGLVHAEVYCVRGWNDVPSLPRKHVVSDDDTSRNDATALLWARGQALAARQLPVAKDEQLPRDRNERLRSVLSPVEGIDLVIAGHTVTANRRPLHIENRLNIDTGAHWADGALTMADPVGGYYWQARFLKKKAHFPLASKQVIHRRIPKAIRVDLALPPLSTAPEGD